MKSLKRIGAIFIIVSFLNGCSTNPDKISGTYVSPLQYQGSSCNQIRQEFMRVNRKILEITGKQRNESTKDKVALGVGLVLFWPALFFMIGDDKKDELARLKGEYEALERIAIQKECDIVAELEEAKRQREKYKEEEKEQRRRAAEKRKKAADIKR